MTPALALLSPPDPHGLGGLVALVNGAEQAFPLRSVRVRASIVGDVCRMEIDQRYSNPYDRALDVVHLFPLPADGAVIEMELRAGECVVRLECREREDAVAAAASAKGAGFHALPVPHLPPGTDVHVRMVIVERLAAVDGQVRWCFPTAIASRYLAAAQPGLVASDASPDAEPAGLQPPLTLAGGAQLDLEVKVCGAVRTIRSSLPVARVALADGGTRLAPRGNATVGSEFVLHLTTNGLDRFDARSFSDGAHTLVVVEPPGAALLAPLPRDVVIAIDLAMAMGASIGAVKRAVCSALHGLLAQDRFQVIAFHGAVLRFRPTFVPCTEANVQAADAWVAALEPGGVADLLPAIQASLEGEQPRDRLRTVFVLAGPSNADPAQVAAALEWRGNTRFFALGIGAAPDGSLGRLARLGGGACEVCAPDDDIEAVFAGFEAAVGTPVADGVTIAAGVSIAGAERAGLAGRVLFAGRPVTGLLLGCPATVRIAGRTAGAPLGFDVTPTPVDVPLGAFWARERVAELEDRLALHPAEEGVLRAEILRIALEHRIASRYTAFVSVATSAQTPGERVSLLQPGLLSASRGHAPPGPTADSAGSLARAQGADGSFGADIHRTAAALLALVLLANTRHAGPRKRVALKAAAWLGAYSAAPHASVALAALNRVERGDDAGRKHELWILADDSPEGRILGEILAARFPL